jgi:hypothetical protein
MSRAGKETFLKAVIQAIPTYVMRCFQIPITNCDKMRAIIANQWWGVEDGKKKMHWRSWEWLSSPKALGGMRFRDLSLFNQAMLGKQGWRLLTNPTSLCARVLKGRYFPRCDFWHAPKPSSSSYTWRSILFGRDLLLRVVQWGVGDGKAIKILSDHWISDRPPYMLRPLKPIPDLATVSCLIDEETDECISETVNAFFDPETVSKIMQVPISHLGDEDFVCWPHSNQGVYTVRSAYNLARSENLFLSRSCRGRGITSTYGNEEKSWKAIWKINAPNKMKIHLWRFVHDCLPSGVQLRHRHVPASDACIFCGREESITHAILLCPHAQEVWRLIKKSFSIRLNRREFSTPKEWLFKFLSISTDLEATVLAVTFGHIWEARNDVRNNQTQSDPKGTSARILAYVDLIVQHCYKPKPEHRRETNATGDGLRRRQIWFSSMLTLRSLTTSSRCL